jgi:hypothetical protein
LELFFNELSIEGAESISREAVLAFVKVYRALIKYEITTCRIASEDNHKLHQMIQSMPDSFNIQNFYFSFFRSPYESEMVEQEQDEYLAHEWMHQGKPCIGLPLAAICDAAVLSIYAPLWNETIVYIARDGDEMPVRNIGTEQHVHIHMPQLQHREPELVESALQAEDKKISLRDDHGKDLLMDFSRRLIRCPYVVGVINSLPYNSHERRFIRRIQENGVIEIVLPWTDKGYGVAVKTTGRTKQETEKIGEIIEEMYGGV